MIALHRVCRPWGQVALAAVLALVTPAASAQFEGGFHPPQIGAAMRPDYTRRDIHAFVEVLRLDDDQRDVFESLFGDYERAFREAAESVRDELSAIRPRQAADVQENRERQREIVEELRRMREEAGDDMNPREMRELMRQRAEELREEFGGVGVQVQAAELNRMSQEMNQRLIQWSAQKAELRRRFEGDVREVVLTEEQQAYWPALQRRLRREKTLSQGRLSGESVDLLAIVRDADLTPDERDAILERLGAYEIALDDALERRNTYLDSSEIDLARAAQVPDLKLVDQVHERRAALHRAVRDVNESHAASIADALSREDVHTAFLHAGYPRVYRRTAAERVLNAARAIEGLDPATVTRIEGIRTAYLAEVEPFNVRLVQIVRTHEPQHLQRQAVRRAARLRGLEKDVTEPVDPIRDALQQRSAIGERYLDHLHALLTPEQAERLPDYGRRLAAQTPEGGIAAEARRESPMQRYDRNGDGRLDADEIDLMRDELVQDGEDEDR